MQDGWHWQLILLLPPPPPHRPPPSTSSNIVDMDMGMGAMSQRSYLHFGTGDPVWFQAWGPASSGAIVGACVGLALLAVFSRLLVGIRGVLEAEWRRR